MRNRLVERVYHSRNWSVFAFPRLNKTLLWDNDSKTCEIYNGMSKKIEDKMSGSFRTPEHLKQEDNFHFWKIMCYILCGALAMGLIVILISVIFG